MKKIFIDCGGHDGCSVRKFINATPDFKHWKIYSFEPNKRFHQFYSQLPTELIPKAVCDYNGIINFYQQKSHVAGGSTTLKQKDNLGSWLQYPVQCVDLSKWIIDNFTTQDYIVLKLDIEGQEYNVLNKMINDKSLAWIDKLYIEWHWDKLQIEGIKETHEKLIQDLKAWEIEGEYWDAFDYRKI